MHYISAYSERIAVQRQSPERQLLQLAWVAGCRLCATFCARDDCAAHTYRGLIERSQRYCDGTSTGGGQLTAS